MQRPPDGGRFGIIGIIFERLYMSKKYSLNKEDLMKIGVGALVALAGALLTYVSDVITEIDFGDMTPFVVALASILVNVGRKFLQGK